MSLTHARAQASKKVKATKVEEQTQLASGLKAGDEVFAVAHIYASFNDTFLVSSLHPSINPSINQSLLPPLTPNRST